MKDLFILLPINLQQCINVCLTYPLPTGLSKKLFVRVLKLQYNMVQNIAFETWKVKRATMNFYDLLFKDIKNQT